MNRTHQNPSNSIKNQTDSTTSRTATEHYSIETSDNRERETRAPRSNDSHLGITIRGGWPASGGRGGSTEIRLDVEATWKASR